MGELRPSRTVAEYDGREVEVAFTAPRGVAVYDDGGRFADSVDRGQRRYESRAWVMLPAVALDHPRRVSVTATWRGERVIVNRVAGEQIGFSHFENVRWAREQGLDGSQHEGGWTGRADRAELSDVTVAERAVRLT